MNIHFRGVAAIGLILGLLSAMPVQARWLEASSQNFVIYADGDEEYVRSFSRDLERFHGAVVAASRSDLTPPSPSNRVTVYVVRNEAVVRSLYGRNAGAVGAFYIPRAGGSLAIVPRVKAARKDEPEWAMIALLHEYVHHLMYLSGNQAMPAWVIEGLAEFYASARFGKDGSVALGFPANHRGPELAYAPDVPLASLLDSARSGQLIRRNNNFYGKSWLLYHYLSVEPARKGELVRYLALMNEGVPSLQAATTAFGDLQELDRALKQYRNRKTLMTLLMPAASIEVGEVSVRALREGEAAMMPVRIRSKRGVTRKEALYLLPEARRIAAAHAEDPAVLAALAEAEYDAGNDDAAIAAANAALASDALETNAYLQKGYALLRKAEAAEDKPPAFRAAREPLIALNRLENDHPLPLVYNYTTMVASGLEPTENAKRGLRKAVELAPYDSGLRLMLAAQALKDQESSEARSQIEVLAFNPHGGALADHLRDVLARLDAGEAVDEKDLFPPRPEAGD